MFWLMINRLNQRSLSFISHNRVLFCTVLLTSMGLFGLHSYKILSRYFAYEVQQISFVVRETSLTMPSVFLELLSTKSSREGTSDYGDDRNQNQNQSMFTDDGPSANESLTIGVAAKIDTEVVPPWALFLKETSDKYHRTALFSINHVSNDPFLRSLTPLDEIRKTWPLRSITNSYNYYIGGLLVTAFINATNFFNDINGFDDSLRFTIRNLDNETDSDYRYSGLQYYEMLPCENLVISISLEHYNKLNRPTSPCRNEYPQDIKKMILKPDTINPLFEELPYDPIICKELCINKYWMKNCSCFISERSWLYAGAPVVTTLCSDDIGGICSSGVEALISKTPNDVVSDCSCFPKCSGYSIKINDAQQQIFSDNYGFQPYTFSKYSDNPLFC